MKAVQWKKRIKEQRDALNEESKAILVDAQTVYESAKVLAQAKFQAADELNRLLIEDEQGPEPSGENGSDGEG